MGLDSFEHVTMDLGQKKMQTKEQNRTEQNKHFFLKMSNEGTTLTTFIKFSKQVSTSNKVSKQENYNLEF